MHCADPGRFEQQRSAAGDAGGFGILPLVADDEGVIQIEMPFEPGFDQQAGFGFATGATIGLIVRADQDIIQSKSFAQQVVHPIQFAAGLVAALQAGLVGRCNQHQARCL